MEFHLLSMNNILIQFFIDLKTLNIKLILIMKKKDYFKYQICATFLMNMIINYKYRNKKTFSKSEKYFFDFEEIRTILKQINKKRF